MTVAKRLDKLLSIAIDSLIRFPAGVSATVPVANATLRRELVGLLRRRNGFYAFEAALHVFPLQSAGGVYGLDRWNAADTWVDAYDDLAHGCFFFAEDILAISSASKETTSARSRPRPASPSRSHRASRNGRNRSCRITSS
jgi:hypothetical protein